MIVLANLRKKLLEKKQNKTENDLLNASFSGGTNSLITATVNGELAAGNSATAVFSAIEETSRNFSSPLIIVSQRCEKIA